MTRPLCIDLFCGLGGWTEGFLAEGWRVVGFDIERHVYGQHRYPGLLVLQDARTIHGAQFRHADMIVASSPCQEFSYRAMPWKRAKALPPPYLGMELFAQAERIQREACEAAGRNIPMVQENVNGAQPWVGRAAAHYGSFYLWGDVPALMPIPVKAAKVPGQNWSRFNDTGETSYFNMAAIASIKAGKANVDGKLMQDWGRPSTGIKNGGDWFGSGSNASLQRRASSGSRARKAASALIAKIPLPLARHIAHTYYPADRAAA